MDNSVTTRHVKRLKRRKTDITFATWNVRTLKRPGKLKELRSELDKYGVKIAALQELRWRGEGMMVSGQHILMYSGGEEGSRSLTESNELKGTNTWEDSCTLKYLSHKYCLHQPKETHSSEKSHIKL
ncbi:hypothetical protein C0J52_04957 [Blattella germanica]|nr:hypothetical protein C0J52_04957 [Blattella germanica]